MHTSPVIIDFAHIRSALTQGHRVALFIRHSERPEISPEDKDFGKHLGLTPRGVEQAREAGSRFAGFSDVRFFASPMARCRLTAQHFAEGMGFETPVVEDADPLGVRGYYFDDPYAVQDLMRRQGYMAYMLDYLRHGIAPHSRPIDPATAQTAEWLKCQTTTQLGVYVSHDIFIASFLTGLKIRTFTADNWVGFLHGAALIHMPASGWICHACVPDLAETRIPPRFSH
ncbi:MAG: histidine phosphatase family protein [bacterium]